MRLRPPWFYRQSSVIPYRHRSDSLEVLLVTSWSGRRWVFPKGVIDRGETPATSAAREAVEEAGVRGVVERDPLGTYTYEKWGGTCTVEVFAMLATDVLDDWPESGRRQRRWLAIQDAAKVVKPEALRALVAALATRPDL
jgi:phosphohistidine phosphatase